MSFLADIGVVERTAQKRKVGSLKMEGMGWKSTVCFFM